MLRTEGIVDRSRDLTSMFDESLDMDSRHSALSSSDFSDREHGSHRSDNFNGFDQGNVVLADIFDHDELSSTQNRLDTFKLWPVGSPILPIDLATAGFYYLGADDQVKCYKCDLVLRQWRTGEDPWVEHKQFRPSCPFIREVESGSRFEVTCEPVEASVNDEGQLPFAQRFPRYGDQRFPSAMPVEPRSIEAEPSSFDPPFSMYPERFQERAVQEERSSGYRDPMDAQAGYRSQQPGYQGRLPEYQDRDIRTTAYQRPEAGKRNQYVVVGQGPDRVHVQGAAVYQLQPEDKVCVRVERQGLPRHVTSVRDLKPVHPERHEVSQHSTASESTSKAFQPPSMELNQESSGSRLPFTTMASSPYYPAQPSKAGLYEQSGGKNFAEETGRQYRHESTAFQAGIVAPMYTTQQSQGRPMQSLTKSGKPSDKSFSQETGAFKAGYDKPRPVSVAQMQPGRENKMYPSQPGPGYYDPYATQKSGANEESLAHETGNRTSHYPENMKRLQTGGEEENYPPQPSRETGRPQNPPGPNARGTRTPFPGNVALPVQDPSLGTVQRPLFRQEEARHVASPSELSSEHHRLTTFVDWPPDCPIREWELSVAGFYYLGSSDSVKCYKCGIALRNWDPTDTPWGEHKKWSPDCPLVIEHFSGRARAPEENLQRQRTSSRERFTFSPEEHPSQRPEQPQAPNDWQVPVRRSGSPPNDPRERSEQTPAHVVSSPSIRQGPVSGQQCGAFYPQGTNASTSEEGHMVSGVQTLSSGVMEGRSESQRSPNRPSLSSPASSPRGVTSLDFDMERLAEMGFTQREVDEAVSKRIEDAGDTFNNFGELVFALVERQERPAGRVLLPRSPMQTNQNAPLPTVTIPTITTSSLPRANTNNRAGNSTSAVTSPTTPAPWRESLRRTFSAPVASLTESEESLEQKLERMQEERTCKICMDDEVGVVFQPCGHLSCCPECATGMDLCPMCRAPIQEKIRTYLS